MSSESVKRKLIDRIEWLNTEYDPTNNDILLISNTVIPDEIYGKVQYFLYDHRNQLFRDEFTSVPSQSLWKITDDYTIVEYINNGFQKHGLSVLINLFNSLLYAKSLGYTHFQRFEVDDLFGSISKEWIKLIPERCLEQNKKGLFYYNVNDISFHYFFCEIDYFLEKIKRITSQEEYMNFLTTNFQSKEFRAVENYLFENFKFNGDYHIWKKTGEEMKIDFPDTVFNSESSPSSLESFYRGSSSRLYRNLKKEGDGEITRPNLIILSYNYSDLIVNRKIEVYYDDHMDVLYHSLEYASTFTWNELGENVIKIMVYENEEFLYEEMNEHIGNYILFN